MRQLIIAGIIIAIVAAGIGAGVTALIMKSKVDKSNDEVADLKLKLQDTEKSANRVEARATKLTYELTQVRAELDRIKALASETPAAAETADVKTPTPAITDANQNTPAKVYIVKEGDSLWKIAESQLGNGTRYKEILKLNPKISENDNLIVGAKLNLPAK